MDAWLLRSLKIKIMKKVVICLLGGLTVLAANAQMGQSDPDISKIKTSVASPNVKK